MFERAGIEEAAVLLQPLDDVLVGVLHIENQNIRHNFNTDAALAWKEKVWEFISISFHLYWNNKEKKITQAENQIIIKFAS